MARMTAAVIGCGGMGRCHLSALKAMEATGEIELTAACDVAAELLEKRAGEYGIPRRFSTLTDLLEKARPEIVAVATQTRQHRDVVLECARAGVRGILCEKPLALDLAECDEMLDACRAAGTQLAVDHQGHLRPATLRAQQMVAAGEIGELIIVRGVNKGGRKAGNEFMEMGTHTTDRMLCFGGKPTWCQAYMSWDGRGAAASDIMDAQVMSPRDRDSGLVLGHRAYAHYGFTDCVIGELSFNAWDRTLGYGLDLVGSRGQLALRGSRMDASLWHLPSPEINPARDTGPWQPVELPAEPVWGSDDDSVCVMYRHLIRSIETGEPHPSSGEVGRDALEMIMAIYESHRRGTRIDLPLADRRHPLEVWRAECAPSS